MSDERCIEQVENFIHACANASRRYHEMGGEDAKRMADAYAWMGRGAVWAIGILLGEADAETAFNDPIRTMVKGFSDKRHMRCCSNREYTEHGIDFIATRCEDCEYDNASGRCDFDWRMRELGVEL